MIKKMCLLGACFIIGLMSTVFSSVCAEPVIYNPGDVNEDGIITLEDAQQVLKAALKIETLEGNSLVNGDVDKNNEITLEDAQIILKVSLRIIDITEIVPSTSTEELIEEPTGMADVYIAMFDNYGMSKYHAMNYVAIQNELPEANNADKKIIEEYFEEKLEVDVIWVDSYEQLIEEGLGKDYGANDFTLYGKYLSIDYFNLKEDKIQVTGSILESYTCGAKYEHVFEKQDGKWILIETIQLSVS